MLLGCCASVLIGAQVASPTQQQIGPPPRSLHAESVQFPSASGAQVRGWLIRSPGRKGTILLMHGIRSNRLAMLSRARFLLNAGYSVLLFDFQANGETIGSHQTFGALESLDARAACTFARTTIPDQAVGAIGTSLGGAAAILGPAPMNLQALVIEAVYPTIEEAAANRIRSHLGPYVPGRLLAPLLLSQLRFRAGVSPSALRPIDRIGATAAPLFLICGEKDVDTTPDESRRLFQAASEPKQFWELMGAGHQDFHAFAPSEYERRVLAFFETYMPIAHPGQRLDLPADQGGALRGRGPEVASAGERSVPVRQWMLNRSSPLRPTTRKRRRRIFQRMSEASSRSRHAFFR